ncbi:hypothetical protein HBH70_005710 [Parastagonospora nodorum]|nr:hypothetical protein HBH52_039830 [Parastagonospora nodorum]KAH4041901.1 hypothetical protein HBI09_005970 [Parastagonospora nodorum]KAH4274604.1 hypothetical protein HBI03_014210 [Parastagonospora nodorum]KAH4284025.1 hypothetical protein HBI04_005740 [Parastagonospora nodorum]KAH4968050.1 hypothetical protein HBI78_063830 [Parastagonospora nodorum]
MTTEQTISCLYQPLPPNQIRVLLLEDLARMGSSSTTTQGDGTLVTLLKTISLDEVKNNPDDYFALSYCWKGYSASAQEEEETKYIRCNDHLVPIRPNLYSALWHIAKYQDRTVSLWVDALCIDQSSIEERSQQVFLMGDIYKSMGSVIAWLGSEGERVATLFKTLADCAKNNKLHYRWGFSEEEEDTLYSVEAGVTYVRYCGWFDRVWTFQEICLARHAKLIVGTQSLDWETFTTGWKHLYGFEHTRHITAKLNNIAIVRTDGGNLLQLLKSVWNRHASNPKDKVYGVLGLYRGSIFITPNYNTSIREVMVQAAKAIVEETQNLDILHHAWARCVETKSIAGDEKLLGSMSEPRQPTWTPDWVHPTADDRIAKDLASLPKLEFPNIHPSFTFNVKWKGEHLVGRGLALGRRADAGQASNFQQREMLPFPDCAFTHTTPAFSSSQNLGTAFKNLEQTNPMPMTDIPTFASAVKRHDEGRCMCPNQPGSWTVLRDEWRAAHGYFDWIVVLFGARTAVTLRPNWVLHEESKFDGTFRLTETLEHEAVESGGDLLDVYGQFGAGGGALGGMSCAWGEFEIR